MKIYLLSFAGGSSLSFMGWKSYFKKNKLEVLDYKGHGFRMNEKPDNSIEDMAADIAEQIAKNVENEKFIIFGHSMGGIIAWHAAWILILKYGVSPAIICPSACPCPLNFQLRLPEEEYEILKDMKQSGHVNANMLQSKYFTEFVLPIIKHDYQMVVHYRFLGEVKELPIPIYIFYGTEDGLVSKNEMAAWQKFSSVKCHYFPFEGNHFYFDQESNKRKICEILDSLFVEVL